MKEPARRSRGPSKVEIIQVIAVEAVIGKGIEGDPIREIHQYWSLEGKLLAENDTISDEANGVLHQ